MSIPYAGTLEIALPKNNKGKVKKKAIRSCGEVKRCLRVTSLQKENARLAKRLKELECQIDILRRRLYPKKKKKVQVNKEPKKKGPPFGHKGVTRPKPEHIDEQIEVPPDICPRCGSNELSPTSIEPEEHIQEDIVLPKRKVTRYIKPVFKCKRCDKLIRGGLGPGEIPRGYIGPRAKAIANYLRYDMGIPQHKIKRMFKELFDLPFDQTSVAGFENQLTRRGQGIYDEMKKALLFMKLLYIDETGWKEGKIQFWLWCYCNKILAFYHIDRSRGSKVVTSILKEEFNGIIISDFLSAYDAIGGIKQKCLPHVLRMIEKHYKNDPQTEAFLEQLKELVKHVIYLFKHRKKIKDYLVCRADVIAEIRSLLSHRLNHKKIDKWRRKLKSHQHELYECLFHPKSDFNNNFVERMLRPSVIMRKITYGNRSKRGIKNHSVIMSLLQTAKLHNHHPSNIFYRILTKPDELRLADLIRPP